MTPSRRRYPTHIALWACLLLLVAGCQGLAPAVGTLVPTAGSEAAAAAYGPPAVGLLERPSAALTPEHLSAPEPTTQDSGTAFSGRRARRHVDHLADQIGARVAGSPAQFAAADYLESQFMTAGLATERQLFSFPGFDDRGSSIEVLGPDGSAPECITLTYSAGGEVEGELVQVGLARHGDFDPASVRGRVGLAERGEIRFSDKVTNLAEAGAIGLVIFNNQPGSFAGSLVGPGEIPVVSISQEDGQRLLQQIRHGSTVVRLKVEADFQERTGLNVVATASGGPRTVVIGAHYDSVRAGPGANDNASGTATVVELARITVARQYPFTVRFVAFGAEEIGLLGSRHFVALLDDAARRSILAMINLDMVGVGDQLALGGDAELVDRGLQLSPETGQQAGRMGSGPNSSSDHASFQSAGVPALFVHRRDDPRYHTADDRTEYVLEEHLASAGQLVLALLDDLAAGRL